MISGSMVAISPIGPDKKEFNNTLLTLRSKVVSHIHNVKTNFPEKIYHENVLSNSCIVKKLKQDNIFWII